MANGVQIFNSDATLLLSSQWEIALYHSSTFVPADSVSSIPLPNGVSNSGVTVWPDNGHAMASISCPSDLIYDYINEPAPSLGAWKPVVSISGGQVNITYPTLWKINFSDPNRYRIEYSPANVQPHSGIALDFWVN